MSLLGDLGTLLVRVSGDTTGLTAAMVKSKAEVQTFAAEMKAESAGVSGAFNGMSLAFGAVGLAVVGAAVGMTEKAMSLGDQFYKLRAITGMTGEQLSAWATLAHEAGVETNQFAGLVSRFSLQVYRNGPAIRALGIDTKDTNGHLRGMNDILMQVADRFKAMPDGPEKTALALQMFGRAGRQMIRVLDEGSAGLKEAGEEAKRLGVSINDTTIDALHNLSVEQRRVDLAWQGLTLSVAQIFMPVMAEAFSLITTVATGLSGFVGLLGNAPAVLSVVASLLGAIVVQLVAMKAISLAQMFGGLISGFAGTAAAAWGTTVGLGALTAAEVPAALGIVGLRVAITGLLASVPIVGWLALLVTGLIEVAMHLDIVKAALGTFGAALAGVGASIAEFYATLPFASAAAKKTAADLRATANQMADDAQKTWDKIHADEKKGLGELPADAGETFGTGIPNAIKNTKAAAAKAAKDYWQTYIDELRNARTDIDKGLNDLTTDLKNAMTTQAELARLGGLLNGAELARGMKSADPLVVAQTIQVRNEILAEMDKLSGGMYTVGQNAADALEAGFMHHMNRWNPAKYAQLSAKDAGAEGAWDKLVGSFKGAAADARLLATDTLKGANATKTLAAEAKATGDAFAKMAADAKTKLTDAFAAIKSKAKEYFDADHQGRLQQIEDSHRAAQSAIDDQIAMLDSQLSAAEAQMAAEDAAQRRSDLQSNLTDAQNEAYDPYDPAKVSAHNAKVQAAQRALADFERRQRFDALRAQIEERKKELEEQRKADEAAKAQDIKTQNERAAQRQRDFDAQLAAIQKALAEHHITWKTAQERILKLLADKGADYHSVAALLGDTFAKGLYSQVDNVALQAERLALATDEKLRAQIELSRLRGQAVGAAYAAGIASEVAAVEAAAAALTGAGASVGTAVASGLTASAPAVKGAATTVAKSVTKVLKTHSPAEEGPLAEDQSVWGRNFALAWGRGFTTGLTRVATPSLSLITGVMRDPSRVMAAPAVPAPAAGGGDIHYHAELHAGNVFATDGEQRAFVRGLMRLMQEEMFRSGQPVLAAQRTAR